MISYTKARHLGARLRWTATVASFAALSVVAATFAACSPTEVLEVVDPDIIDPRDVNSAAGANGLRLGALRQFNTATSGGESLLLLGGLFADEWINGDSFIARQEIDQRVVTVQNSFLTTANRALHRARLTAEQAIDKLAEFAPAPATPSWQVAEMYFVQAYVMNIIAEHYCDGIVFSSIVDGVEQYGSPITTAEALTQALAHANTALALTFGTTANDLRVQNALKIIKARILVNMSTPAVSRLADAAAAVAGVPTDFKYEMLHSQTTNSNQFWNFNNNARRYNVSNNEGMNGLNFATANDPRVPVCVGNDTRCRTIGVTSTRRDDLAQPLYVQMLWPLRESPVAIVSGVEARLIEAEALLTTDPTTSLGILNAARATVTGLTPLADAGTEALRVNQLFRERAFWLFGRGTRTGDMRRLIRQYGRASATVFPTGAWHKSGNYGGDVNFPVPQAEQNNPNVPVGQVCINRAP